MIAEQGIYTLAMRRPEFALMAYNMALSGKARGAGAPIAVYADDMCAGVLRKLQARYRAIDAVLPLPPAWSVCRNVYDDVKIAKLNALAIPPFRHSLFLDADTALIGNADVQLDAEAAAGYDVSTQVVAVFDAGEGRPANYTYWADAAEAVDWATRTFDAKPQTQVASCSSTYVYQNGSAAAANALNLARNLYLREDLPGVGRSHNGYGDEFFLNMAWLSGRARMRAEPYGPVYFRHYHGESSIEAIRAERFAFTPGAQTTPDAWQRGVYDALMDECYGLLGVARQ